MDIKRYSELMGTEDAKLTDEEIADNWHFCPDFDFLLMQADLGLMKDGKTCICGYEFPKPPSEQTQ